MATRAPISQHRNNAIHYRSLLIRACVVMERYDRTIMPNDLRTWWQANRPAPKERTSQNEIDMAAVAQLMAEYSDLPDEGSWEQAEKYFAEDSDFT